MAIRVGLLTDSRLHRDGLRALLGRVPGIDTVGVGDLSRASEVLALDPEILLVDVAPGTDPGVVERLAARGELPRIVILGLDDRPEQILAWLEAGATGYMDRGEGLQVLVETIRSVHEGRFQPSQEVTAALVRRVQARGEASGQAGPAPLTPREASIADLIGRGLSNKEISERLQLGETTVKNHIHNILRKMHFHNRAEIAARLAPSGPLPDVPADPPDPPKP